MKKSLFIATALLALAACTREMNVDIPTGEMTITARTETSAETRTVVEGETHVYWEPGDEIKVFAGEKSGKFTTDITAFSATAEFKGTLSLTEGADLWAVYPYSDKAVFSNETITTVLPSEQVARTGSFGKDMNLAIAHSTTSELQFYNVGGGVRFSLSQDGITEVVLEGLKSEILAGKVKVGFLEGKPVIQEVTDGKRSITITPPDGESFKKNAWYYIVTIPGAMENGFTFHFKKASDPSLVMPSTTYPKSVTIKRGTFGILTYVDKGMNQTVSDEAISFQDPLVKSIVVKYFDTSKDGELSYHEAAVVLSFLVDEAETRADDGKINIFAGTGITSFDEMVYFTGLTRIDEGAFAGCTELMSITIPENVESIGDDAFNGCTSMESITITAETPPTIGEDAFANTGDCPINVPEDAVEQYLSAWNEYAPRIQHNSSSYLEPEAVDLGLPSGLKWASFNLGASKPEEYGDYFAWGETEPKDVYSWSTYKWCIDGNNHAITKYCIDSQYGNNEFTDGITILNPEDDAAYANLGGEWRMPTDWEWAELFNNCSSTWTTENGVYGCLFTSKDTGNSIFLPAAGSMLNTTVYSEGSYCFYWSSSLDTHSSDSALAMYLGSNEQGTDDASRYGGTPIRAVYGDLVIIPVESVSLDKTELELFVGDSSDLIATILPDNASIKSVIWSSSDETVASVSSTGVVMGIAAGSAVISITTNNGGRTATCNVTVKNSVPEAVDLGLSVKWASFNLGATKPEEYGDYYAWGETEPKDDYSWMAYKWCKGSDKTLTKYCANPDYGYDGFSDGITILDPEDDAATVTLGASWRMPSYEEWTELMEQCTWTWTQENGADGWTVSSNFNDNSIFLPASGFFSGTNRYYAGSEGMYWSTSLNQELDYQFNAWSLDFMSNGAGLTGDYRCDGLSIRPVYGEIVIIPVESVSLDKTEMEIPVGDFFELIATVLPEDATKQGVVWSSSDEAVASVSSSGLVIGKAAGIAVITVTTVDGGTTAICHVTVNESVASIPVPEAIDLGLPSGIKWASFNLGASKPEEYGDYYAWGETVLKYSCLNPLTWRAWHEGGFGDYKWLVGGDLTKYCTDSQYGYHGFKDDKTHLDSEDDAAHVNLGGKWRIPTDEEWTELRTSCTWTWTTQNGVDGRLVTGPNGSSIFLPAAGCVSFTDYNDLGAIGYYWSSSLHTTLPFYALYTLFDSQGVYRRAGSGRPTGQSVRPVYVE